MHHTGKNMEYYILKCYQGAKNKCPDVEQGFDRFDPKIKKDCYCMFYSDVCIMC